MTYTHLLLRFGELNTKGKNKIEFIRTLEKNVKHTLKRYTTAKVIRTHDRIYIEINQEDIDLIANLISNVSGIQSYSKVVRVDKDINLIKKASFDLLKEEKVNSFALSVQRGDKTFPYRSLAIINEVATDIIEILKLKVNLHNPDIKEYIEIRDNGAYLYTNIIQGLGGFPLGVSSKALLLMSGGIDSPVAGFQMLKKGVRIKAIHFASPPYTSDLALEKVRDLLKVLTLYQPQIKLTIVNITTLQEAIINNCTEPYNITILRRMMFRISQIIAGKNNCKVLVTGESIGQVASQTLESMKTINAVVSIPVIRPLATIDKTEIIKQANKIGTFDISIRPYEDCCTIFTPLNPVTKPTIKEAEYQEKKFLFSDIIYDVCKNIIVEWVKEDE
ncbi:MAG: tRNA 4-thiouridine(8) synthase ThiI [Bacillales bacterium]|jgi:thiamine biosynthesis protein ThiI|nr:tRNA 4-thiouridine(8) synthase ThiI [Bacillales bacterium]